MNKWSAGTIGLLAFSAMTHVHAQDYDLVMNNGRGQLGKIADLTIFDPKNISDNSDYKVGGYGTPTTGIPYVVVNGVIVVKDSEVLPVKPGRSIRFPVEERGRLEPLDVNKWLDANTIGLNPGLSQIDVHDESGAGAVLKGTK